METYAHRDRSRMRAPARIGGASCAPSPTPTRRAGTRSSSAARRPRSSIASAGARSSRRSFAIARITCSPSAARSIVGILPLAEVQSRLFGHALVSLPFCVYGGPGGRRCRCCERALIDAAVDLARIASASTHLELRNRRAQCAGLAAAGSLCHVPQGPAPGRRGEPARHPAQAARDGAQGHQARAARARSTTTSTASSRSTRTTCTATARRRFRKRISRAAATMFGGDCEVLTVVDAGGRPVSSVLSFYFRDEVLPYYAGDTPRRATSPPTTSSTGS